MKTTKILFILLLACIGFTSFNGVKAQPVSVNFSVFHDNLSQYGRWIDNPRFGQVWVYDEPGFRPYYSDGHWDYTDYGWTWVSDYDWGWAPFHYGRWEQDPYYGWMWIPGYEWAPAWVAWGEYGDDYGWAPLGYGMNIGVNLSFGAIPYNRWVFGPRAYINNSRFRDYYGVPGRNFGGRDIRIINNIGNERGGHYMMGPDRREVERYSRSNIEVRNYNNNPMAHERRFDDRNNRGFDNGRDNNLPARSGNRFPQNRNENEQRNNGGWQNRDRDNSMRPGNDNNPPTRQNRERNGDGYNPRPNNYPPQQNPQRPTGQYNNGNRNFGERNGGDMQSPQRNFGGDRQNNGGHAEHGNRGDRRN